MSTKRINVLVYSGNGATIESVRHCMYTLRRLLAPSYAVIPVTGETIIKEPWTASCAALVFPGGADTGYCRTLNGEGNRRIRRFVEGGGKYVGFCAGGYYGTKRCEFEVGDKYMEVVGDRELAFFPGISRGCAFAGFVYNSEKGARAAELSVHKRSLATGSIPNVFKSYYNGGSVFVDAPKYEQQGVEVLASYTEKLSCDPGEGQAAVVYCKVGDGAALLTGPHPEFSANNLQEKPDVPGFSDVIKQLKDDENHRMDFLKACLTKLGLTVSDEQNVPSLSRMYMSSLVPSDTAKVLSNLQDLIVKDENGEEMLKDVNDTFHVVKPSAWSMVDLTKALPTEGLTTDRKEAVADKSDALSDLVLDYNSIVKQLLFHDADYPDARATPYFNHNAFYANLQRHQERARLGSPAFGNHLLYGEVVTSTNTMLERNVNLLSRLPHGFTMSATTQVAGRGRGSNVWVSPAGSLIFSTTVHHPISRLQSAPVVFLQYLAAMAIVSGIKNYDGSLYKNMPVKLKWPNDIYALDPTKYTTNTTTGRDQNVNENYIKIGGILVNSHYNSTNYIAVCGIGLNVSNTTSPTTTLNQLIPLLPSLSPHHKTRSLPPPPPFTLEPLLASILAAFESLYTRFLQTGFDLSLEQEYYAQWLHTDQIVTLEAEGGVRARVKGITRDFGLLKVEELGWEDRETGKTYELMTDSNSFDFFKGLLKRKV